MLVQLCDRAEKPVLAFERDGCLLHNGGRFGSGALGAAGAVSGAALLVGLLLGRVRRFFGHQEKFRFAKLKVGIQSDRRRANRFKKSWFLSRGGSAMREKNQSDQTNAELHSGVNERDSPA